MIGLLYLGSPFSKFSWLEFSSSPVWAHGNPNYIMYLYFIVGHIAICSQVHVNDVIVIYRKVCRQHGEIFIITHHIILTVDIEKTPLETAE